MVGRNLLSELQEHPDWDVVALSRSRPDLPGGQAHVAVDLTDAAATAQALEHLGDVTGIFFSAFLPKADPGAMVAHNLAMLRNLLDVIEPIAPGLRHVNIMHGAKVVWQPSRSLSHAGP